MRRTRLIFRTFAAAAIAAASCILPQDGHTQVVQQPSSMLFTGKDAEAVIADALVKAGVGDDIKVSINETHEEDVITQAPGIVTADADSLEVDRARNYWHALLLLKADGRNLAPIKLSGRFDEMMSVPILKRRVQSNEVIAEDDIAMDRQPVTRMHKTIVTNAHDLVGKSPRHTLSPGRPIRADEIANPAAVIKGTQVTLFYKTRNIEIKTFGEALDAGAVGDVIRVRNTTSKAIIQGTVESNDHVRVTSPDMDSAEAL